MSGQRLTSRDYKRSRRSQFGLDLSRWREFCVGLAPSSPRLREKLPRECGVAKRHRTSEIDGAAVTESLECASGGRSRNRRLGLQRGC